MTLAQRVLLCVALLIFVVAVTVMILLKVTVRSRDRVRRPAERVYGAGDRRILLLYQPSNRGGNVALTLALARALSEDGRTVTVNYPSEILPYNPDDYDALIFGSNVYLGETAKPIQNYLASHPFQGKRVVVYVTGRKPGGRELAALAGLVHAGNDVRPVKIRPDDQAGLIAYVRKNLD